MDLRISASETLGSTQPEYLKYQPLLYRSCYARRECGNRPATRLLITLQLASATSLILSLVILSVRKQSYGDSVESPYSYTVGQCIWEFQFALSGSIVQGLVSKSADCQSPWKDGSIFCSRCCPHGLCEECFNLHPNYTFLAHPILILRIPTDALSAIAPGKINLHDPAWRATEEIGLLQISTSSRHSLWILITLQDN